VLFQIFTISFVLVKSNKAVNCLQFFHISVIVLFLVIVIVASVVSVGLLSYPDSKKQNRSLYTCAQDYVRSYPYKLIVVLFSWVIVV
jgi:hypothetical protein